MLLVMIEDNEPWQWGGSIKSPPPFLLLAVTRIDLHEVTQERDVELLSHELADFSVAATQAASRRFFAFAFCTTASRRSPSQRTTPGEHLPDWPMVGRAARAHELAGGL